MSTLDSLPPEILKTLFELVDENVYTTQRSLAAMRLSHVSRSFRTVALDCPQLWTCLSRKPPGHRRPGLSLLAASIERSGKLPLEVEVWIYEVVGGDMGSEESVVLDPSFSLVLSHTARWRTFSINIAHYIHQVKEFVHIKELSALRNTPLPILEGFAICSMFCLNHQYLQWEILSAAGAPLYLSWDMPALRTFTIESEQSKMLPSAASRYMAHVRTLTFKSIGDEYLLQTAPTIASMESLTSLHLSFEGPYFGGPLPLDKKWELTQVTTLHVEILECNANEIYAENAPNSLFVIVSFPNLTTLDISLRPRYTPIALPLHGFLVRQNHYSVLETLNIFIRADLDNENNPILLVLPDCYIPSLRHIHIRSHPAGLVIVSKAIEPHSGLEYPGGYGIPSLQKITLDLPSPRSVTSWVNELASKMQDRGCWDEFLELVVKSGGETRHIPRDEVQRWCDDNGLTRSWDAKEFNWGF